MLPFSPSELAKIAMKIEENGMAFYEALAEKTKEKEAGELFSFMAKEEKQHLETFKGMAEKLASLGMPEPHEDDEHVNYIRELIDNIIFTKDLNAAALAEKTSSPVEAIDLALGFEKDSVIFYIQFKKLVPEEEQFAVQGLVDEENHHINRLLVLKRAITSSSEDFYRSQPGIGDAEK